MADLATQYPTTPSFSAVNFRINTPTQATETFSGKIRRTGFGLSYYSFDVQYPSLTPLEAGTVQGFVSQAFGSQLSFKIVLPQLSTTKLSNQTTEIPYVAAGSGNGLAGAKSVQITGCGANKPVLAAGDFFKFNNHDKVYMCTAPCTSSSLGNATLYFSGGLVADSLGGTSLTINNVPFTCILAENIQEFSVGFGGITNTTLAMREVW